MFFPLATSLISVLTFGQAAVAALMPDQVVTNINAVATISSNANSALVPLSVSSPVSQVQSSGTSLVNSFTLIIQSLGTDVTAMSQTPAFDDDEAQDVVDALDDFIAIHQTLLGTVIGKHSFFAQFGVTAPVLDILQSLEAGVDAFADSLIALIPTRTATVNTGAGQLGDTLTNTINTYEQICIPSPLYPKVLPICIAL